MRGMFGRKLAEVINIADQQLFKTGMPFRADCIYAGMLNCWVARYFYLRRFKMGGFGTKLAFKLTCFGTLAMPVAHGEGPVPR